MAMELNDGISELPDHILHYILSFLPVKDAARTSILSKRWRNMWDSLPYLNFGSSFLKNVTTLHGHRNRRQLKRNKISLKLVDEIILRRSRDNLHIERIYIHFPNQLHSRRKRLTRSPLNPKLKRWITCLATSSLRELYLSNYAWSHHNLPSSILSAKSLSVLSLRGFTLSFRIKFPSLRKLELIASVLDDDIMKNLFKGCPLLEDFSLDCCSEVEYIHVTGLLNLKRLVLKDVWELKKFEIDTPQVEFLRLKGLPYSPMVINFPRVRHLSLWGEFLNDKCLDEFVSRCVLLENLSIGLAPALENVKISSDSLKTLEVSLCKNLGKVEIIAPTLEYFYFQPELLPNLSLNVSNMMEVKLDLWLLNVGHGELATFLGYFNYFRNVCMIGPKDKLFIPEDMRMNLLSPLCDTRNLAVYSPKMVASELLDYMLWLSPQAETLSIIRKIDGRPNPTFNLSCRLLETEHSFLKFLYDRKVVDRGLSCPSCKLLATGCWKHFLTEVRIERFRGDEDDKTKMKKFLIQHVNDLKIVDTSALFDSIVDVSDGLHTFYDELFI